MRIYVRRIRLREKLDMADYLLVASALNALALVTCDTLTYQTGALDGQVRSEKLSKVGLDIIICLLQIAVPGCKPGSLQHPTC